MLRSRIGLVLWCLLGWTTAWAQSCDQIKSQDEQNYCRSIMTGERRFCKKIANNDTKNLCLAKADNEAKYCKDIANPKIRKRCQDSIR